MAVGWFLLFTVWMMYGLWFSLKVHGLQIGKSAILWSSEQKKHIVTGVEVHFEYLFSLFFQPLAFFVGVPTWMDTV